jgi:hypothetical protein
MWLWLCPRRRNNSQGSEFATGNEMTPDAVDEFPVRGVVPIDQMFAEDEEELRLLQAMALAARNYLTSFKWCKAIREAYFGDGIGKIVAVFFFHIEPSKSGVDEWLWVVVGDLPSAFLVVDDCKTPSAALEGYIYEMSKWVKLAKLGRTSKRVIPVNVPATPEYADMLEGRLKLLEDLAIPAFRSSEATRA